MGPEKHKDTGNDSSEPKKLKSEPCYLKNTEKNEKGSKDNGSEINQAHHKLDNTQNKIKTSPNSDKNRTVKQKTRKKKTVQNTKETYVKDTLTTNNNIANTSKPENTSQKNYDKTKKESMTKKIGISKKRNMSPKKKLNKSGSSQAYTMIDWLSQPTNSSTSSLPIDIFPDNPINLKYDETRKTTKPLQESKTKTASGKMNYKTKQTGKDKHSAVRCSPRRTKPSKLNSDTYSAANVTPTKQKKNAPVRCSPKSSTDSSSTEEVTPTKRRKKSPLRPKGSTSPSSPTSNLRRSPRHTPPKSSPEVCSASKNLFHLFCQSKDEVRKPTKKETDQSLRKSIQAPKTSSDTPSTADVAPTKRNKNLCIRDSASHTESSKSSSGSSSDADVARTKRNKNSRVSNSSVSINVVNSLTHNNSMTKRLSEESTKKDKTDKCSQLSGKISKKNHKNDTKSSIPKKRTNKKSDSNINLNLKNTEQMNNAPKKKKSKSEKKMVLQTLDDYLNKASEKYMKRKHSNSEINENCVDKKKKIKAEESSDLFKKYGVAVPSLEEILKEQKDLAQYKSQIETFKDVDDKVFELPFSVKDLKSSQVTDENVLSCKHLSMQDIEEAFGNNLDYISAIFKGKTYNERHERFFSNNGSYKFTVKDLNYNTSTIVFSFDQRDHMIKLMKKEFDATDRWTLYFFQVLLPELCLKIFMDTHSMDYDEAIKYLDTRPILDD